MPLAFLHRDRLKSARNQNMQAKQSRSGTLRFILLLAICAWALRSFIAAPFSIPSGSMLPTLYIGDYLVVVKWPYGYSTASFPFGLPAFRGRLMEQLPRRGDVVVFRHPTENSDLIKRVIGLPGDKVELRAGRLVLNGKIVPRQPLLPYKLPLSANTPCRVVPPASPFEARIGDATYCVLPAFLETLPGGPSYTVLDQARTQADDFAATTVPPGHVFLMGDNRDDSLDSRFPTEVGGIGMVSVDQLIGRAEITFWSTDGSATWWKPWTWFRALRIHRLGHGFSGGAK